VSLQDQPVPGAKRRLKRARPPQSATNSHLNSGDASSTRNRRPLRLIYYEAYLVAQDAKAREQFLKSGSGKRFIRRQLAHCLSGSSR
jgi:putative endonuclease